MDLFNKKTFVDRVDILFDFETGKYFKFQQRNGKSSRCDTQGHAIPRFHHDFSGFASTLDRKDEGRWNDIPVLHTTENIPKYIGRPAKYIGHTQVPRPGIKMSAGTTECPYTIPGYLEPIPPKLGKVSVKRSKKAESSKMRKTYAGPSFLETLDSQFAPNLSMTFFNKDTFPTLKQKDDVTALTAKNKQKVMSEGLDLMALLRQGRVETKDTFGSHNPPFTPLGVRNKETERDLVINPKKHSKRQEEFETDKRQVEQRRRGRYIQFFKLKEEEAKELAEEEAKAMAKA